ncbi:histidine triad nucleotide-binding protein 3 [Agrilus planipennis]|uniref:Adenosine 5'-monophosphoramidase HINT3 n=1 Tax=Agrilus planipennis TaxID=224129 RepID=A0A1W4W3R7_AGRPL|nr:histidine triad nucleotide-binding protein 3 [Agrilus planipennis]
MTSPPHPNCIFCKIIARTSPAEILLEDDDIIVFKDVKPASRFHYLAVPKLHIENVNKITLNDKLLVEKLLSEGKRALQENGANVNDLLAGFHWPPFNSVSHMHLHLISPASEMSFLSRIVFRPNTWWFGTVDYVLNDLLPTKL